MHFVGSMVLAFGFEALVFLVIFFLTIFFLDVLAWGLKAVAPLEVCWSLVGAVGIAGIADWLCFSGRRRIP